MQNSYDEILSIMDIKHVFEIISSHTLDQICIEYDRIYPSSNINKKKIQDILMVGINKKVFDINDNTYRLANTNYKTKCCENYTLNKYCQYGTSCSFLHGKHELEKHHDLHSKSILEISYRKDYRSIMDNHTVTLQKQNRQYKQDALIHEKIAKQLKIYVNLLEKRDNIIEEFELVIKHSNDKLIQLESYKTLLEQENEELKKTTEISLNFTSAIKQREKSKSEQINQYKNKQLNLDDENNQLNHNIDELEVENTNLHQEIDYLEVEHNNLRQDINKHENNIDELKIENIKLRQDANNYKHNIKKLHVLEKNSMNWQKKKSRLKYLEYKNTQWKAKDLRLMVLEHRNMQWKKKEYQLHLLELEYNILKGKEYDIHEVQTFIKSYCSIKYKLKNITDFTVTEKKPCDYSNDVPVNKKRKLL